MTRISVIPDERKLLLGVDGDGIFKEGFVYQFQRINGEIVVTELEQSALPKNGFPSKNSTVTDIVYSGQHLITKTEYENRQF